MLPFANLLFDAALKLGLVASVVPLSPALALPLLIAWVASLALVQCRLVHRPGATRGRFPVVCINFISV